MPRLYNIRLHGRPKGAVLIDRTTPLGNPFIIGRDGSREEVIEKNRKRVCDDPKLMEQVMALRGQDLLCWCWPNPCHGDFYLEVANKELV